MTPLPGSSTRDAICRAEVFDAAHVAALATELFAVAGGSVRAAIVALGKGAAILFK